jgi:hypothetical protein
MMETDTRIPDERLPFADRRRWTAGECDKIEEAGMLVPGEYELLNRVIVETTGRSVAHSNAHTNTLFALIRVFGQDHVMLPVSIRISDYDRPEPDLIVTVFASREYLAAQNEWFCGGSGV